MRKVGLDHCILITAQNQTSTHLRLLTVNPFNRFLQALAKLEASLAAGQTYEGHELFKTVFHRLRSRKLLADSYVLAEVSVSLLIRMHIT